MNARPIALALWSLVLLLPAAARASDVAVLDLRLSESTPAVEKQVMQWLQASLRGVGYGVLEREEVKKRLASGGGAPGCTQGPCLEQIGRLLRVRRVLVGGIAVHGSSYDILLTLVDTESGCSVAQVNTRCDVCNFADVGESVARAARTLHAMARRFESSRGKLVVAGPAGAAVLLDGAPLGQAPLSRFVAPGRHELEVRAATATEKKSIVVVAGGRVIHGASSAETKAFLAAEDAAVKPKISWPSWLVLAGGGALLFSGAIALALDEDCATGRCDGRRETRGAGLALIGLGTALTATAGVLFWRATRRAQRERAHVGGLTIAGGQGRLGLSYHGSF